MKSVEVSVLFLFAAKKRTSVELFDCSYLQSDALGILLNDKE